MVPRMDGTPFDRLLLSASNSMGSFLDVAMLLEVPPLQVYWWMARLDEPSGSRLPELERRLRSFLATAG